MLLFVRPHPLGTGVGVVLTRSLTSPPRTRPVPPGLARSPVLQPGSGERRGPGVQKTRRDQELHVQCAPPIDTCPPSPPSRAGQPHTSRLEDGAAESQAGAKPRGTAGLLGGGLPACMLVTLCFCWSMPSASHVCDDLTNTSDSWGSVGSEATAAVLTECNGKGCWPQR